MNKNELTIVVSSDLFGNGDVNLGALLMKSYMYALSENEIIPDNIIFMNSGVKLCCEGSGVLESLAFMKDKGANIMSCGTCLDFYNLKDKLIVGEVGNMNLSVKLMNESKKTIRI